MSPAALTPSTPTTGGGICPIGAEPAPFGRTESFYLEPIATDQARYGHDVVTNADVPDHVTVYRELLAGAPDGGVTIITVGRLKGLWDLLASPPDAASELDGMALVRQKAARWICMGGRYPNTERKPEANFCTFGGAPYSSKVVAAWPRTVLFSGFEIGVRIETGMEVIEQGDENPVARGYRLWFEGALGPNKPHRRASWDQTAVLVAGARHGDVVGCGGGRPQRGARGRREPVAAVTGQGSPLPGGARAAGGGGRGYQRPDESAAEERSVRTGAGSPKVSQSHGTAICRLK